MTTRIFLRECRVIPERIRETGHHRVEELQELCREVAKETIKFGVARRLPGSYYPGHDLFWNPLLFLHFILPLQLNF
jgi:hypothetical protein